MLGGRGLLREGDCGRGSRGRDIVVIVVVIVVVVVVVVLLLLERP
jgi:hypothetical protein